MPVVINEIVIKTNVESPQKDTDKPVANNQSSLNANEIVKQAVSKVLEILDEKKQR